MYNQITSNKRRTTILMIIFIAIILALGYVFGQINGGGYTGLIIAAIISFGMTFFSYYAGDKVALASSGAKEIKKTDNPYLYRVVENLCIASGMPTPKIYIISDMAINAFATGRDPQHASIAVTQGAIQKLENEELEGVIAHELSHIKNYDIRLMTVVIVLVGVIVLMADWIFHLSFFRRNDDRENGNLGAFIAIAGIVLMLLSPIFAELIKLAISRRREYLADASAALLTRYPEGLAKALEKISMENKPMKSASAATAHLYISNPFGKKKLSNIFSTHPPIQDRIAELKKMAV
jgi:heat shock protein HtpX